MVDQVEIHRKVVSDDVRERREAVYQLRDNFVDLLDKKEAWDDLIRLTRGDYRWGVRCWHNIKHWLTLTWNEDSVVRWRAVAALGSAFQYVSDKDVAWDDLIRLTWNEDSFVRWNIAGVLGSAFQYVSDKDKAWDDLIRLTGAEDSDVRAFANYSLGRVSIFKATEAESEKNFRKYLKDSVEFFGKTKQQHVVFRKVDTCLGYRYTKPFIYYSDPSEFCLPFYRSFYAITFGKAEAKGEVEKYLSEAKSASKGSENKETLLEAIENLASALSEAHKVTDFDVMKSDLRTYRRYCDRAADLISDAAEAAPGATRVLRRGLPIIGERIRDIQEKAEALCRETRGTGTPYEPLGRDINKWTRELSDRGYLRDEKDVPRIRDLLGQLCSLLHEDDQDYPCKIVEGIREGRKPEDTLSDIATALSYLVPSIRLQPPIDKTRSDRQPSQKTSHSTTVFAGAYSTVVVPHTETESGDVTVNTAVTEESQPDTQLDRSSKRTAIEISADIAVHVLVYTVLHHFAEDLMSIIAPILVITALITLLLIIRHAKSR